MPLDKSNQPRIMPGRIVVKSDSTRAIELKFFDAAGNSAAVLVDFGELSEARAINRKLRNGGYIGIPLTRKQAIQLDFMASQYASSPAGQSATFRADLPGGWGEDCARFVYGNVELPSGQRLPRTHATREGAPGSTAGTLKSWQERIGQPVRCSTRAMLMIVAALAAPTLIFQGVQAGGFGVNLFGPSSRGKSTALRVGASLMSSTFLGSWDGTPLAFQEIAQECGDLPITVDGMEAVSGEAPAKVTDAVAYQLAEGRPRARAREWSLKAGADTRTFRTVLLSTAETARPRARRTGAAVRLMYVPVNANLDDPVGIFDRLPDDTPTERLSSATEALARQLNEAAATHYGSVMPAFISYLIENRATVTAALVTYRNMFRSGFDDNAYANAERRALDQFAACYAAGRLAVEAGILPWGEAELLDAVRSCARDALELSPDRARRDQENVRRIFLWLSDPARTKRNLSTALTKAQLPTVDCLATHLQWKGQQHPFALVLPSTLMQQLSMDKNEISGAMRQLKQQGRLITELRSDTLTKQFKFSDGSARFFVIRSISRSK
ncbi:DUF927 domain-containing protein [Methylobacterium sp. Leaf456]|uniref:DUF927 domain-containing protein n=1 Tax=Methylobacterium sp. Leaf456 TaxID=1736382 RepID=UPI0009E9AD1A|nr:DUF927 domain-containing protein [Methylobacterium sp. Leaf456]